MLTVPRQAQTPSTSCQPPCHPHLQSNCHPGFDILTILALLKLPLLTREPSRLLHSVPCKNKNGLLPLIDSFLETSPKEKKAQFQQLDSGLLNFTARISMPSARESLRNRHSKPSSPMPSTATWVLSTGRVWTCLSPVPTTDVLWTPDPWISHE